MSGDRGGRGDGRRDQMRPSAGSLTALEVAIRRGCAPFTRAKNVRIHTEAHRTARVTPLEPGIREDAIESFALRVGLHAHRSGHDQSADAGPNVAPAYDLGGRAEILDARVRARADEHRVDLDVAHRGPRGEVLIAQRAARALAGLPRKRVRIGNSAVD